MNANIKKTAGIDAAPVAQPAAHGELTDERIVELYRESFNAMVGRLREAPKHVPDTVLTFARAIAAEVGARTPVGTRTSAETVQWRNIQKVVKELASFCFGSASDPKFGIAYTAIVTSLTAKDGLNVQLEPLPAAAPVPAPQAGHSMALTHTQLLEQCLLVLADAGWRCSPPITGLRNLQEKIAAALNTPSPQGAENNEGEK